MSETQDGVLWVVEIQDFRGEWVQAAEDTAAFTTRADAQKYCAGLDELEVPARVVKYVRVSE